MCPSTTRPTHRKPIQEICVVLKKDYLWINHLTCLRKCIQFQITAAFGAYHLFYHRLCFTCILPAFLMHKTERMYRAMLSCILERVANIGVAITPAHLPLVCGKCLNGLKIQVRSTDTDCAEAEKTSHCRKIAERALISALKSCWTL